MKLGWYYTATALDPWECPTLEMQLAACAWAEQEAARLTARKVEAPLLSPRSGPPPAVRYLTNELDQHSRTAREMQHLFAQGEMVRKQQEALAARGQQTWWDKQPKPPAERTFIAHNGVVCHEIVLPPQNAPRPRILKPHKASKYLSVYGQHRNIGWNLMTDKFECQDCGTAVSVMRDFEDQIECHKRK